MSRTVSTELDRSALRAFPMLAACALVRFHGRQTLGATRAHPVEVITLRKRGVGINRRQDHARTILAIKR